MASPSKGRKRLKKDQIDGSQKSIRSFFVSCEKVCNTCCCALKQEKILHSSFVTARKVYDKRSETTVAVRKKQTLLVPFEEEKAPNRFKIKGMNPCKPEVKCAKKAESEDELNETWIENIDYDTLTELTDPDEPEWTDSHPTTDGEAKSDIENTFGLFGVSSSEDEELGNYFDSEMAGYRRRYFSELPDEILENIFCQMPLVDLLVNMSVVCKRWHKVISNVRFLLWKKHYYRYKYCDQSRAEVHEILGREHLHDMITFPVNFSRFMSKFRIACKDDSDLLQALKNHSKYSLTKRFQSEIPEKEQQSCWSVTGLLALVSSTVYDIQEIVSCLMCSSACLLHEIIECLYCIALVFFALMACQPGKYSSYHYRIYYALYLFENSSNCTSSSLRSAFGANKSGQQCILKYRDATDATWMTHEQVRIMNHNTKHGDVLKVVAFAGTGKTTTLVEYTKLRPSWRFLNVAYNKSVQEQAEKKFPPNVVSRTVHSLAYRAVGCKFKRKLASNIRVNNIMENLPEKSANFLHAKRVADTLANFICSSDPIISTDHVPYREITDVDTDEDRRKLEYYNSEQYLKLVVRDSKSMWTKMSDPKDVDARITHDGYLKIYQLSKPVIRGYDCILIDEAQDCTPAVADILLNQAVAKILVGDPHQQIYSFRGATNAMALVDATHTYYLTQSFRFGPEIASVASSLLDVLKGVRRKTIVGVARQGGIHGDQVGQLAIICRSNFTLFNNAVLACTRNQKTRIGFAGGLEGYNLDRVLDIYKLHIGTGKEDIKDKFIRRFQSFHELKKYATKAPDHELLGKIKIVEAHNIHIPSHIQRIKKQYCRDIDQAEVVFSTAHKAKGLEFDTVRLAEDFLADVPIQLMTQVPVDEKNLLYVAVTRAKHRLQLPTMLYNVLVVKTDLFLKCAPINAVMDISSTYCVECRNLCDFSASYVAVKRDPVTLGTTQKMDGGFLCASCVSKCVPVFGKMLCAGPS